MMVEVLNGARGTAIMKSSAGNGVTRPDDGREADKQSAFRSTGLIRDLALLLVTVSASWTGTLHGAGATERGRVAVIGGIVMPRRPVTEAIALAMQFLKKADGAYVPGRIDGELAGFEHMMPGHTARYCLALAHLYAVSGDEQVKKKAISGINALTYMQSEAGLFRTFFQLRNAGKPGKERPNWYSQHLYTVCHVLEAMPALPEIRSGRTAD